MNDLIISKKELILDAAIKIFARHGYYGSRVSDITEEAGIAYGLVYRYFRSKDDVLISIFQDRWNRYLKKIEQINRDLSDPKEKLRSIIQYIFRSYRQNPDMMKVLIMDVPRLDKFYEQDSQGLYNRVFEKIATIVKQGQDKGIFNKEISPILGAYMLHGAVDAIIRQYVYNPNELKKRKISIRNARDHIIDFLVQGFSITSESKD
ncbi:MAG: TetR/AcrR family transcriptional regulator [Deltaproteobacteria bacterium]|nr:TetR/AcrR family transcriptional regulator [Deltaproteobacteria bacterium]